MYFVPPLLPILAKMNRKGKQMKAGIYFVFGYFKNEKEKKKKISLRNRYLFAETYLS